MCAAILSLEGVTLGLTTPVLISVVRGGHQHGAVGRPRPRGGVLRAGRDAARGVGLRGLGWVLQGVAIGLGFVIPLMFVLGAIFALLWGTAYFLGRKIERERAAAYAGQAP